MVVLIRASGSYPRREKGGGQEKGVGCSRGVHARQGETDGRGVRVQGKARRIGDGHAGATEKRRNGMRGQMVRGSSMCRASGRYSSRLTMTDTTTRAGPLLAGPSSASYRSTQPGADSLTCRGKVTGDFPPLRCPLFNIQQLRKEITFCVPAAMMLDPNNAQFISEMNKRANRLLKNM